MNIQKKVTSEGSVNRRPRNLHKLSCSQFGFQYYWLMSPASYTVYLLCTTTWSTLWVSILCYSYFLFVFPAIGIGNFLYISCSYLYWWCWSCLIWFSMQYSVLGQLECDNLECLDGKYLVTIYVISVFFYWV